MICTYHCLLVSRIAGGRFLAATLNLLNIRLLVKTFYDAAKIINAKQASKLFAVRNYAFNFRKYFSALCGLLKSGRFFYH